MVQEAPLVTVVIVNHNGIEFVDTCLRSVFRNKYPNFEVVFVDNASSDGSLEYVKNNFAHDLRLRIIENPGSFGPAVGRNKGIAVARGKYIAFLDNDTEVDSTWLIELVKVLESDHAIGVAQSKLLNIEERKRFDCAGDYLGPLGFLIERSGYSEDKGQFDYIADILSAKSAASIIRKDIINVIGGFDKDYYMYLEETDLCWRVWLADFRVVFVPDSIVYHAYNTSKKEFRKYYSRYLVRYYGCRNYISTLIKNLGLAKLIRFLPLHLGCWFILSGFFMLKGHFKEAFYILKGIGWNLLNIGLLLEKRHQINLKIRKISDSSILNRVMDKKEISYYLDRVFSYISEKTS